jgi:SAM-dependent methyltransferase
MDINWRADVWKQFGAAIDMLNDAIGLCPDQLWTAVMWKNTDDARYGQFWYVAYHALFWLDLYLTGSMEDFTPPSPFIRGALPDQPYSKDQILAYLGACRKKCQSTIEALTDEKAQQRCKFEWIEPTFLELQLYSMRHVQEHAAQLSLVLGQHGVMGLDWIASARDKDADENVQGHYSRQGLGEAILAALSAAGKDIHHLKLEDLAPVDEFHIRGREATLELAAQLKLNSNTRVLDVGCGIGGASRYLTSQYGCHVTGLDLTDEYCRVAQSLSDRLGLASRVDYRQGSALDLPFEDSSFDVVWTQHAAMNIADKPKLYSEIARVLRPEGYFAMYDVLAGPVSPLVYPVPWARDASISFLATPDKLHELLESSGLHILSWRDTSDVGRVWFKESATKLLQSGESPTLGLQVLLGPDFRVMSQNLARNLNENRIVLVECVAQKLFV